MTWNMTKSKGCNEVTEASILSTMILQKMELWDYGHFSGLIFLRTFTRTILWVCESMSLWHRVCKLYFLSRQVLIETMCCEKEKKHGTGAKWSVRCPSQHSSFGVRFTVGNCRCFHNLFQNVEFVDFEKIGCIMQSTSQWSTQQLKIIDFDVVPVFNTVFRV